jgi:hypothetical protein
MRTFVKILASILAVPFAVFLYFLVTDDGRPSKYDGREVVKRALREPDSAQFRNDHLYVNPRGGFMVCGEVNSRNAFGGYTGFKRYIAGAEAFIDDSLNPIAMGGFEIMWKEVCNQRAD